jgi:hypothetical protein
VCQKGFRKSLARPDNPGRILSKYPAPLFLAKCFRNFGSGRGPDIWPDNVPVLYQGRIIRAGYFGNIRPPRFSLRTGRKSTLEGGRTFGRTLSLFCPEDRIIRGGRIIRPLLGPDYPAPRKLQRLHFEWGYKYPLLPPWLLAQSLYKNSAKPPPLEPTQRKSRFARSPSSPNQIS